MQSLIPQGQDGMLDIAYIGGSVAFFALMLAWIRACESLGKRASGEGDS